MTRYYDVCQTTDIPEGQARMFIVGEQRIGVFNVGGEYFALDDYCPHAGASLALGIITCDVVRCRIHHWRFRIRDGAYLDEDNAKFNVRTYPVRTCGTQVQVEI